MNHLATITLFGLGPAQWIDTGAAAEAIASAEVLEEADLAVLVEGYAEINPQIAARMAELARRYHVEKQDQNGMAALGAQGRLASIVRGTDSARWSPAAARMPERKSNGVVIREAARRADIEDAEALRLLMDFAEETQAMIAAKEPLAFAKAAAKLTERLYQRILDELEKGETAALKAATRGLIPLSQYLDRQIPGRGENLQAILWLHHRVTRVQVSIANAYDLVQAGRWNPKDLPKFQRLRHGVKDLFELFIFASGENTLHLQAKGIQLDTNIINNGVTFEERALSVLETALTELIHNAAKYADSNKDEKWFREYCIPLERAIVISDNGIGIQDIEEIWSGGVEARQAPDHAPGTGMGLGSIKEALEKIDWKIKGLSTPDQGTTFKLLAPPGAITYSESYLQYELKRQREQFQREGKFDFARLTPQLLSQMEPMEQLAVGKQAVAEIEAGSIRLYDDIRRLTTGDMAGLKQAITRHFDHYQAIQDLHERSRLHPDIEELFHNLFSSALQLPQAMESSHLHYLQAKRENVGRTVWTNGIREIFNPGEKVAGRFMQKIVYRVTRARRELAETLVRWLAENLSVITPTKTGYQLEGPTTDTPNTFTLNPLHSWPPDPQQDLALRTYLEMLGWSLKMEREGETVRVWLDF